MRSPRLSEKWGSKEIWLRAFLVRCGLIWLFRGEFRKLELGPLQWLASVLADDDYLIANVKAAGTNEIAFTAALESIMHQIDLRVADLGDDPELRRLRNLVHEARFSDPLQQIFSRLARNTTEIYHSNVCRMTVLEREWLIGHPYGGSRRGYVDPYYVDAQTRVADTTARVELQVHLDRFEVVSLLAVPALLTHELVCHAHAREDRNNDRSLWAEGVMDWVALFYFDEWANDVGLPYELTKLHGGRLWDDRMTLQRQTGRLAADAMTAWFTTDPSVKFISVARHLTAMFALEYNVVDAPLPAKDELASRMANIRHDAALQKVVHAWRHAHQPLAGLLP